MSPRFEPITGRYLHLDLLGKPHRLYVEEAGKGIPLLCLHTAGSDGRQFRGLMNDARITKNYRVIAFDMPWHGKSSPPAGWQDTRIPAHLARLCAHDRRSRRRARPRQAGRHGLLDRRAHRAASRARACPERFRALIGLEIGGASPRPITTCPGSTGPTCMAAWSAPAWCPAWSRRPRRRRPLGDAVALHAERPRRVQGRPAFLHDRRRHPRQASARSTSRAARCSCSPANTTIPALPRARWRSPSAPARRPPS